MPSNPDYEIAETFELATPAQLRAYADPLRMTLLDLVLERAATVTELAEAVGRPKSTVAHHVGVLVDAGLMRVVRTRRVRAVEERSYGRTARTWVNSVRPSPGEPWTPICVNELSLAAAESVPAHLADTLCTTTRHVRIPRSRAMEFWHRLEELVRELTEQPREGDQVFAFVAGLYPTDHPRLPDPR